jgi:hypothetical protein
MREFRESGSVRGALSNERPYRDHQRLRPKTRGFERSRRPDFGLRGLQPRSQRDRHELRNDEANDASRRYARERSDRARAMVTGGASPVRDRALPG